MHDLPEDMRLTAKELLDKPVPSLKYTNKHVKDAAKKLAAQYSTTTELLGTDLPINLVLRALNLLKLIEPPKRFDYGKYRFWDSVGICSNLKTMLMHLSSRQKSLNLDITAKIARHWPAYSGDSEFPILLVNKTKIRAHLNDLDRNNPYISPYGQYHTENKWEGKQLAARLSLIRFMIAVLIELQDTYYTNG